MQLTDEQLANFMEKSGMVIHVTELPSFPWPEHTFSQLVKAMQSNQIIPAVYYDPDARHTVLSSGEKAFTNILGYLMFLIPTAFIVGSIWTRQWILLIGFPGFLLGAFVSNPWARGIRQLLLLISVAGAIIGFWKLWPIGLVCLGLLISLCLAVYSREYVNSVVKRETMKSETLFCYAYQAGILLLKDAATGEIYGGSTQPPPIG